MYIYNRDCSVIHDQSLGAVNVEVAVLGSPSPNKPYVSVDVKQHLKKKKKKIHDPVLSSGSSHLVAGAENVSSFQD